MLRWLRLAAVCGAVLAWSNESFAVVQNTDIVATKPAGETGSATLTLTQKDSSSRPVKTDTIRIARNQPTARQVVRIDPNKAKTVEVSIETEKGRGTFTVDVARLLAGGPIDLGNGFTVQGTPVAATGPASTPRTAGPARTVTPVSTTSPYSGPAGPSGIYIAVTGGGTNNETTYETRGNVSAGAPDVTNATKVATSNANFTMGFIIGMMMPNLGFFQNAAIEAEFTYLNSKTEIQGLPGLVGFPAAANDLLRFQKEWMLTFSTLLFVPYEPLRDFYVKLGFALVREKFEYDCRANGFCGVAPATPAFVASDTALSLGFLIGLGYQWRLQQLGLPNMFARVGWDHIFVEGSNMAAGAAATRLNAGKVSNDLDRFYFTLAWALSASNQAQ